MGDERTRRERIAWLQSQPCQRCWQAQEAEASKSLGAELSLPPLEGSNDDCLWAERIRAKMITHNRSFHDRLQHNAAKLPESESSAHAAAEASAEAYNQLRNTVDARWWIDNRFEALNYVRDQTAATIQPILDKRKG